MLKYSTKGDLTKTISSLKKMRLVKFMDIMRTYGDKGVVALSIATPKSSSLTSESWSYRVKQSNGIATLEFMNSNINNGVPIAIILQLGHATRSGSFIQGVDYINPALAPIFEKLSNELWREVSRL